MSYWVMWMLSAFISAFLLSTIQRVLQGVVSNNRKRWSYNRFSQYAIVFFTMCECINGIPPRNSFAALITLNTPILCRLRFFTSAKVIDLVNNAFNAEIALKDKKLFKGQLPQEILNVFLGFYFLIPLDGCLSYYCTANSVIFKFIVHMQQVVVIILHNVLLTYRFYANY